MYYLLVNLVTLTVWGWDKACAVAHRWRVPERTLLILIALGGIGGCLLGMALFRHKIRRPKFYAAPMLALIPHALLVFWLFPAR